MKHIMVGLALSLLPAAAWSGEPCCAVTSIDAKAGIVSIKDAKTGKVTQYKAEPAGIKALKVGQKVDLAGGRLKTATGAAIAGRVQP